MQSTIVRRLSLASAFAAALALAACSSERAVGPNTPDADVATAQPSHDILYNLGVIPKKALLRSKSLKNAISASATIGAAGGTIVIPEAGFTLTVPANAIGATPMTIKVTALAGRAVAYSFEPHGVTFARGLSMKQNLTVTTWSSNASWLLLGGGYFKHDSQVNTSTGAALLDETLPLAVLGTQAYMQLWHFSGYMVSMD